MANATNNKVSNKWDIFAVILGLIALLKEGVGAVSAAGGGDADTKQKIVSILLAFVSKVDEGMWTSLISNLDEKKEWPALTRLLESLDRFHERDSFRLTVVDAPVPKDVVAYSDKDPRVKFLKQIADLVDDPAWGPEKVRDMLRTHELATENKVAERALAFWKGSLSEMEKVVCEFFGVKSLDKITLEHLAAQIQRISAYVPPQLDTEINPGFLRSGFKDQPRLTWSLLVGSILVTAAIIAGVIANG